MKKQQNLGSNETASEKTFNEIETHLRRQQNLDEVETKHDTRVTMSTNCKEEVLMNSKSMSVNLNHELFY